jgi:hypothetical protein
MSLTEYSPVKSEFGRSLSGPATGGQNSRREVQLRVVAALLLAASLVLGLANIALLPPWEGFDETAHFSYLQQIADSGSRPHTGSPLSAEVESYAKIAPMPYRSTIPYNDNGNWTYFHFFAAPREVVELGRAAVHDKRNSDRPWQNGKSPNWEAQHPPIYYSLLAPLYSLSKGWSLAAQLFLLRSASYAVAWIGLCLATLSAFRSHRFVGNDVARATFVLAAALWPCLFPSWFPEMARLGNDCLVVFLIGVSWLVLMRLAGPTENVGAYVALGLICSVGLLTKAFFLPFVAVLVGCLSLRMVFDRNDAALFRHRAVGMALLLLIMVAGTSWWYVEKIVETHSLLGADYSAMTAILARTGGLINGLYQHASEPLLFLKGVWHVVMSFRWSGTWSLVQPPYIAGPLNLTITAIMIGLIVWLRNSKVQLPDWISILTLVAILTGIFYQVLLFIAAYASPGAPGWYLHAYAPALAPLLGFGLAGMHSWRRFRWILALLLFYPGLFLIGVTFLQAAIFSGCIEKKVDRPIPNFSSAPCVTDVSVIFERLTVLAYPAVAAVLFAAGFMLMLFGVVAAMRLIFFDQMSPPLINAYRHNQP